MIGYINQREKKEKREIKQIEMKGISSQTRDFLFTNGTNLGR